MKKKWFILASILLALICNAARGFSIYPVKSDETGKTANSETDTIHYIKGVFDLPELMVNPSPDSEKSYTFSNVEKVIDYDVSAAGNEVAAIVSQPGSISDIRIWQMGKTDISSSYDLPAGLQAKAIVWHPNAKVLFVMGIYEGSYQIFRIEKRENRWSLKKIFSTFSPLRRLVICPRPFIIDSDYKSHKDYYTYRLFFGMDNGDKTYRTVSITENGSRFYQVIGPAKTFTKFKNVGENPSIMESGWALPVAFHPAGHQLLWQDVNGSFNFAFYDSKYWGKSKPLNIAPVKNGTITPTPNGMGFIHWQNNKPGIGIYLIALGKEETQLQNYSFIATPSSVPDGKGIVGLTFSNGRYTLKYLPVSVPLANVMNAWMYSASDEEMNLFQQKMGLFRPNKYDQIYKLYDTENYYCRGYDRNTPTRPYLVTTDIFWELFGAAYQGIFIVKERDEAMPNFWKFIKESADFLKKQGSNSSWLPVFSALLNFGSGNMQDTEVKLIVEAKDGKSSISGNAYSFSDLKPRGHYTSSDEMQKYFKAFRYFTTIYKTDQQKIEELNLLPENIKTYAEKWILSYSGFISPSRSPLVWKNLKINIPEYCQYPKNDLSIFPLSWGIDNEVLFSTVYHENFPPEKQISGPGRMRILPSGVDIAAVFGNSFADQILESDYRNYPPLRNVINSLKMAFKEKNENSGSRENLYNKWINAISVQWADTLNSMNGIKDKPIWQAKRLQTGLASWATLRHSTVLVNERTVAECGEGGFEEILLRAPRGYVEPDPHTFARIADLFDSAIGFVPKTMMGKGDIKEEGVDKSKTSLYQGIINRLKETAVEARAFQLMAEKERKGIPLTNEENEKILYVAGTAEHNFLVFNSLSNKEYALSNPDPIGKITDVAGGGKFPYLMSAVGNTMEWDLIVPFYGRHQIVKGSVYSYYEFESKVILDDKEWREKAAKQEFLPWIKTFVTNKNADGVAQTSY